MAINETATGNQAVAVTGTATAGEGTIGVLGVGDAIGVRGDGKTWHGVAGLSQSTIGGAGVFGASDKGAGVRGESSEKYNPGVHGLHKGEAGYGVLGEAANGAGVVGKSGSWHGVHGESQSTTGGAGVHGEHSGSGAGVHGSSKAGVGVWGNSETYEAIHGETRSTTTAAIAAYNLNPASTSAALYCEHKGQGPAGVFKGSVVISGSLKVLDLDIRIVIDELRAGITRLSNNTGVDAQRINGLVQQVNSIQQAIDRLVQRTNEIEQGAAQSLITLAARVTALEQGG